MQASDPDSLEWWQKTIIYQIYPRSFQDSTGNGVGDLPGIISRLDYFVELGVETLWLSPFYPSPQLDFGYDVSNYCDVDPLFGNLADFDRLVEESHKRGLKIVVDFVGGHSSSFHPWFEKSIRREDPYTDYYVWHDGKVDDSGNNIPPNNWLRDSVFKGSSWTWHKERQQFYFRPFLPQQPKLNYRCPELVEDIKNTLKFWFDRGVDGMRLDAINEMVETADKSLDEPRDMSANCPKDYYDYLDHTHTTMQPETFDVMRQWVDVMGEYIKRDGKPRFMLGETFWEASKRNRYRSCGIVPTNMDFIDKLGSKELSGVKIKEIVDLEYRNLPTNAWPTFVIGNHDNRRVSDRFGQVYSDAFNMLLLTLKGTPTTYYGEEIGMQDIQVSYEDTQDPFGKRIGPDHYQTFSRDPERSPMQWDNSTNAGFSSSIRTWLPVHPDYMKFNVKTQAASEKTSPLKLYKLLARLRKDPAFTFGSLEYAFTNKDIFSYVREDKSSSSRYLVVMNFGTDSFSAQDGSLSGNPVIKASRGLVKAAGCHVDSSFSTDQRVVLDQVVLKPETAGFCFIFSEDEFFRGRRCSDFAFVTKRRKRKRQSIWCQEHFLLRESREEFQRTFRHLLENPDEELPEKRPCPYHFNQNTSVMQASIPDSLDWWQKTIIYQIYPRSFQDSTGNGVGDLPGIISRLDYFVDLGVQTLWLSPFYPSPQLDFGYDISDFCNVDALFGNLADFDKLVEEAHTKGLKIVVDFVGGHSSIFHPWFQRSVKREDPYTDYYVWHDGKVDDSGNRIPPNNWISVFKGSSWAWNNERQQYYYRPFIPQQPKLNYRCPQLMEDIKNSLRFWFDRGVDGMRLDAINEMVEAADKSLDEPRDMSANCPEGEYEYLDHIHTTMQPETFDVIRQWVEVMDEYVLKDGKPRFMIGETFWEDTKRNRYRASGIVPTNYDLIDTLGSIGLSGEKIKDIVDLEYRNLPTNAWPTFTIGNHDRHRISYRFGPAYCDAFNMLLLTLKGTPTTYYGEEIGMQDIQVSYEDTQDPFGKNVGPDRYQIFSRDPARSPMQWDGSSNAGFSLGNRTWLPVHPDYARRNVNTLTTCEEKSSLKLYRMLAHLRKNPAFTYGSLEYAFTNKEIFSFVRENKSTAARYLVVMNFGTESYSADDGSLSGNPIVKATHGVVKAIGCNVVNTIAIGQRIPLDDISLKPGDCLIVEL